MPALHSSHLASADWANNVLRIGFRDGAVHAYQGVPGPVYQKLLDAPSKGKFFHAEIRTKYKSIQLAKPKPKR